MIEPITFVGLKPPPNELQFVDKDIAEAFKNRDGWIIGTPTLIQLNRNLAKIIKLCEESDG